jgi:SAM-dependent methyltransferase
MTMKGSFRARAVNRSLITVDRLRGLDFQQHVTTEELGHDPEVAFEYAPSGDRFLKAVLKDLRVTSDDSILDIGCGKGSAMRLMLKFPFSKVAGVELSRELGSVACSNFERIRAQRSRVFVGDAADFEHYREFNVLYLFNPFAACVMSRVLDRIRVSPRSPDAETVLIYNNPTCHNQVVASGFNKVADYPDEWANRIFVYSNKTAVESRLG